FTRADSASALSYRCPLVRHRSHQSFDRLFVAKIVVLDRLEVIVQFIDQRLAGGNVEFDDVGVGYVIEVLNERPQTVAVGHDDHMLSGPYRRRDGCVPKRQKSRHRIFQALGSGKRAPLELRVARVAHLQTRVAVLQRSRCRFVSAAPDIYLLIATLARALPLSVSPTSVGAVKRFSWFHVDSPWRNRTIFFMVGSR